MAFAALTVRSRFVWNDRKKRVEIWRYSRKFDSIKQSKLDRIATVKNTQ